MDMHQPGPQWAFHLFYGVDDDNNPAPPPSYARMELFRTRVEAITFAVKLNITEYILELREI